MFPELPCHHVISLSRVVLFLFPNPIYFALGMFVIKLYAHRFFTNTHIQYHESIHTNVAVSWLSKLPSTTIQIGWEVAEGECVNRRHEQIAE